MLATLIFYSPTVLPLGTVPLLDRAFSLDTCIVAGPSVTAGRTLCAVGPCATIGRSIAVGSCSTVGRRMAVGSCSTVGRRMAAGLCSAVGRRMAVGSCSAVGRRMAAGLCSTVGRRIAVERVLLPNTALCCGWTDCCRRTVSRCWWAER